MKKEILERALQLGFDLCRFTSAAAPDHSVEFTKWLAEGRHGQMEYLARNAFKRTDPQQVLPGARSIVVLAASYHSATPQNPAPPTAGQIARYARFDDYHDVLAEKLKLLTQFIDQLGETAASRSAACQAAVPPVANRQSVTSKAPSELSTHADYQSSPQPTASRRHKSLWYVDTGPLLERDLAQRAGLGFIGKHTNLISRELGNWFFLCEIITTVELEPDPPEKNHCGSCARCIAACPTRAITAPFQLDARRCISYLTIENKGPIPVEFRRAIGNRIYGCDDCLAVCPWNRFALEGSLMRAHRRTEAADLLELLSLDEPDFKKRFAGSPIIRAKRRGLLRNVCVALGNIGDACALPHLERATADPDPLIAEHARWAIEEINSRLPIGQRVSKFV